MAKEIEEQPITLKNGINEYVDKIKNDINIIIFHGKLSEIKFSYLNWLWYSLPFMLRWPSIGLKNILHLM